MAAVVAAAMAMAEAAAAVEGSAGQEEWRVKLLPGYRQARRARAASPRLAGSTRKSGMHRLAIRRAMCSARRVLLLTASTTPCGSTSTCAAAT